LFPPAFALPPTFSSKRAAIIGIALNDMASLLPCSAYCYKSL
jgi:hypothetical protein